MGKGDPKGGRPKIEIDPVQLRALMRLKPTLDDTAAFFQCSIDTIEDRIKREYGLGFSEFRDQNMVHTRFELVRTAIKKAISGDNVMLIFCLKNLCGWKDKWDNQPINENHAEQELGDIYAKDESPK